MKRFSRHIQHYLPLLGIFTVGVLGFTIFSYDKIFQAALVLAVATAYVAWGIIHHHIHEDLHTSVVIEYLVIAVLGVVVVLSLLFRA
jgi:intracellular septation protein A